MVGKKMNKRSGGFVSLGEPKDTPMKTKFILASILAAFSGMSASARAGTDIHIGINLNAGLAPLVVAPGYYRPVAPIVVERRHEEPSGYWKDVIVKKWVPERWVVSYGYRGRAERKFVPGYFTYDTERVWVSFNREHDHDRDYRRG